MVQFFDIIIALQRDSSALQRDSIALQTALFLSFGGVTPPHTAPGIFAAAFKPGCITLSQGVLRKSFHYLRMVNL